MMAHGFAKTVGATATEMTAMSGFLTIPQTSALLST